MAQFFLAQYYGPVPFLRLPFLFVKTFSGDKQYETYLEEKDIPHI